MGKQPNEFIPVKYTNNNGETAGGTLMNIVVGTMFLAFFYSIYKNRN
jgi:riboflavin transporter FmnP